MPDFQEGVDAPEVKKFQQQINAYYDASVVAESGEFDKDTTAAVKRFQGDVKIRVTGIIDDATAKLLAKPPKISGHLVKFKGQEPWLTDEQYDSVLKALAKSAQPVVDGFKRKAEESRILYDSFMQARKDTFFLIPAMVDAWSRISLPNESVIKASESAVAKMQGALKGGDAQALIDALKDGQGKVEAATVAIKTYRDGFYSGGERLIKSLEMVKEGCVDILEVSAAVATGGASVSVTAGVMASVGAYKSLLTQIDKASTSVNFSLVDAFGNVLVDGAVGGTVGALLHNDSFVSGITDQIAKKLAATALKKFGTELAEKVAEKAVKGALEKGLETAVKDLVEAFKPGSKMTMDKAIKDVAEDMMKGAAFGASCGALAKDLAAFTDNSLKFFKPEFFKYLGKIDMKKAWDKGGDQLVEAAMKRLGKGVILDAADDPKKMADVGSALAEKIANDPKFKADMADLVKKNKLVP